MGKQVAASKIKKVRAIPLKQKSQTQILKERMDPYKSKDKKKGNKNFQKSYAATDVKKIGCKIKRQEIMFKKRRELKKMKSFAKKIRQTEYETKGVEKLMPLSTDDKREIDETMIVEEDDELQNEEKFDEFAEYFESTTTPKILLTTSQKPSTYIFDFLKELKTTFPNSFYWPRKNYSLQQICEYAPSKGYTDVLVVRENQKELSSMILIHLPKGPTAFFKLTNVKLNKDIFHHGNVTDHHPELILNNFDTRLGRRVGRFFAALVPQQPEFKGRRLITFHNQRDFIFFRHHRYIFDEEFKCVKLQEIGPRFTLKLEKLQHGVFDNQLGELEWASKPDMYVKRTAAFL